MHRRAAALTVALSLGLAQLSGCSSGSSQKPAQPQGQYPQQQYPQQQYPQQQYPQQPAPAPAPAPTAVPTPQAPIPRDPINDVDIVWLRQRSGQLLAELVAALSPENQQRVQGIPLVFDDSPGEVNAFAACSNGRALMAITDEMLRISAYLAQAQATDERFGSQRFDALVQHIGKNQRQGSPLVRPPAGFFDSAQQQDAQKVNRQHQIFDEQVAFVLGHELAHHHLGHLPCTARPDPLGAGEIARVLSNQVPLFNQPNELAADFAGTNNVLSAGRRSTSGYAYTENGGLLTMRFFAGLRGNSVVQILFDFEASHPAPQIRTPVIQQAANSWRLTGGQGLPLLRLGQ